jgi:hypothetical protein
VGVGHSSACSLLPPTRGSRANLPRPRPHSAPAAPSSSPPPTTPPGLTLAKWKWFFDFQMPLVGIGLMAPLGIAWSMLVGAIISWGVLWPVLDAKKGAWYPADLSAWDARGLFGYQLSLAMGLMLADGLYCVARGCWQGVSGLLGGGKRKRRSSSSRRAAAAVQAPGAGGSAAGAAPRRVRGSRASTGSVSSKGSWRRRWHAEALAALENDALSDASNLTFSLSAAERSLRRHLFMSDAMPWYAAPCLGAALVLLVAAAFALPPLLKTLPGAAAGGFPAPHFTRLLVGAGFVPFAVLANVRGAGTTDLNLAPSFATVASLVIAGWGAGSAGGPAVALAGALVAGGLVLGAAQAGAELGFSFAAGQTSLTSPRAVFIAHAIGCVAGALFAPFTYTFLGPELSLSPLAGPARAAAAAFASGGFASLPQYAGWLAIAALVIGTLMAGMREAMSERARVLVPMPVVMGVIMLSGANVAVGVTAGTVLRVVWRWRNPRGADAYAALIGGAFIAGDGVWALGRGLLGAFGVRAPICMSFSNAP